MKVFERLRRAVIAALLAVALHAAYAQSIPADPHVKIGKLANGLTYYIRQNKEPQKRSELYLVVKAGSNMEDEDQQGLAHFAEHMAFNGTRDFPKNQLVDYLQKSGIRFGADLNAYTSFNETVYQLPLPTDDAKLFKQGFTILSNWAGHVSFDQEEVDKERGIIIEEDRVRGKDAGERMRNQIFPIIFKDSRYAERLPIGKIDIIKSFDVKTIKRYYKDWYRPDLQAVIAVGDFNVDSVEMLIRKNFASLKGPKKERTRESYNIPLNENALVKVVTDPEFSYNVGYIFFKHPASKTNTLNDLKQSSIVDMINRMFSARIQETMEKGNAPFVHASGGYGPYYGGLGNLNAFSVTAVAKTPENMKEAVQGILGEVKRVNVFGFTQTEFDRARKDYLADLERQYKERDKTSSGHYVNEYVQNFTNAHPIPGIEFLFNYHSKELGKITLSEINTTATKITAEKSCVAILEGQESNRSKLPDETTYLSWIRNTPPPSAPYVDNAIDQPLMTTLPKAGKIISEKQLAQGVTEIKLSNGITVVMKPTDFKSDEILFSSSSTGGTSTFSEKEHLPASIAADVIGSSGVANYDKSQLTKLLAGKVLSVSPYIHDHYEGINGYSAPKDITTTFQLIHLYLTQPRMDSNVFKMIKDNYKVNLAARPSFPGAVFQDTISAIMSNYHKRNTVPSVSDVETLALKDVYSSYKDRFADNDDLTFFFVGNFTTDELKPYLETYIASLPVSDRKESYRDLMIRPAAGKIEKNVYKGLEDKASVSLFLHNDYEYNSDNNMMLELLNGSLKIKLTERLREKESGVYTPRVNVSYSKVPNEAYTFHISFSCATANVEKLIQATLDEIALLRKNGVAAEDLVKFQAEENRQAEIRIRDNHFWMAYLSDTYTRGEELNRITTYKERLANLKLADTQKAAQQFLTELNFKRIVLLPEKVKSNMQ